MIVAVDNRGKIYSSLFQANSDGDTLELFMAYLIKTLDEEDKKWRNNTVLMWDNAGYHAADSVLTLLRDQQVPMLFLGPYSYRTAPAEMVFAALKVQHINIYDAPLGKK